MTWGGYGGPPSFPPREPFETDPFGGAPPGLPPAPTQPLDSGTNRLATLSVVFAFVFAPAGALLGHLSLNQIRANHQDGRDRALVGITISYALILVAVVSLVVWAVLPRTPDSALSAGATTTAEGNSRSAPPRTSDTSSAPISPDAITAVTVEPTCGVLVDIDNEKERASSGIETATKYGANDWSAEQRDIMNKAASATRAAADRLIPAISQTPNRFVRQLYEQYVAASRAFADSVPNYTPSQGGYFYVASFIRNAVESICIVINNGGLNIYAPKVPPIDIGRPPPRVNPNNPPLMMAIQAPNCADWRDQRPAYMPGDIRNDPKKANQYADVMLELGRNSANALVYDFAAFAGYYLRVAALTPTEPRQGYPLVADSVWAMVEASCRALEH